MNILNNLFGPQSRNLERALDATSQRGALLTKNLANVNVPGYKREDMDFGIELENELGAPGSRLKALRDRMGSRSGANASIRVDGNSVDLETEVMSIAEMEMRYQMLAEITGRYFQGLQSAIREGR